MTLKLHPSQWIDPHTGAISPQGWDVSMEQEEARWCWDNLVDRANTVGADGELVYTCADSYRAARVWKSAQRRLLVSQLEVGLGGQMENEPETRDAETEDA